ncbi:MAG: AMP-binding protein [Actinobacteria bacterium]|nr:AMP-binding protein [Actinomycetota bacterium]
MSDATLLTIPEALRAAVNGRARIDFHLEDGVQSRTAAEILERARGRAATLVERGVRPGDMVGLVGSNRPEWVEWAYGIWLARAALVPLPAPVRMRDRDAYAEQIRSLASAMTCVLVVAEPKYQGALGQEGTLVWDEHSSGRFPTQEPPSLDSTAIVLCTSGSTSMPKGAVITHRSVAHREWSRALATKDLDGEVSWLPFFHTGGMLGIITPIYQEVVAHTLPAERFARDPGSWFRVISEVGGVGTGAASSAWLVALRAAERKPEGIDLSTVKAARFSLEMIDPDVLDLCVTVGSRFGLAPTALVSAYGMSEGTGLSSTTPGSGIRIETLDLEALVSSQRAVPANEGLTKRVASCGRLGAGVELRILDAAGAVLGEREVGEIVVRSGTMMRGYLGQADSGLTPDGWFATGDVGYLADGELFITGRVKEIIISRGHKYHPEDIERAAAGGLGVTQDRCVAFAKPDGEGEVVIVIEAVDGVDPATAPGVIRRSVGAAVGGLVTEVVVVTPDSIPRTPTGKMKRNEARNKLQAGSLDLAG